MSKRIYLIDDGKTDGAAGLVKEINTQNGEDFDMIRYINKFGTERYYVFDTAVENDSVVVYKLVNKIAQITDSPPPSAK